MQMQAFPKNWRKVLIMCSSLGTFHQRKDRWARAVSRAWGPWGLAKELRSSWAAMRQVCHWWQSQHRAMRRETLISLYMSIQSFKPSVQSKKTACPVSEVLCLRLFLCRWDLSALRHFQRQFHLRKEGLEIICKHGIMWASEMTQRGQVWATQAWCPRFYL